MARPQLGERNAALGGQQKNYRKWVHVCICIGVKPNENADIYTREETRFYGRRTTASSSSALMKFQSQTLIKIVSSGTGVMTGMRKHSLKV